MGIHRGEKKQLSARGMLEKIRSVFSKIPAPERGPKGLKSKISTADCLMSGLAIFGLKVPSLLQFDQAYQSEEVVRHNLKTLYGVETAPCDTYLRERLDQIDPRAIRPAFTSVFSMLQRGKVLEDYKFLSKYVLIPFDGTGMFSSNSVHCINCCERHHKDGAITYYHQMLGAIVVHPDQREVFPICPEPISKADGYTKNDCEQNAMARLLTDFRKEHPQLEVIFTEDALGAKGPYLKRILAIGAHFIVNVNPEGNPSLFKWLKGVEMRTRSVKTEKETIELRYCNGIPLNDANQDFEVNFIECLVTNKKGKKTRFTYITDLLVTEENVYELARGGRARWKIENETFNTLKNQGYQFEHNFGHGNKHLCHVFGLLMFLAFLVDQVQQKCCGLFQAALLKAGRPIKFWNRLRYAATEHYVDSWEQLFEWLAGDKRVKIRDILNSS